MLIKVMTQAIPIKIISCFKIPLQVCEEIGKHLNKFWWGFLDKKRKIHWLSWDRLSAEREWTV